MGAPAALASDAAVRGRTAEAVLEEDDDDRLPCGGSDATITARRVAARQRQIEIGKARPEYLEYVQRVPPSRRKESDPQTPDPCARVSKRQFDRQLSNWRRMLHEYDDPSAEQPHAAFLAGNPADAAYGTSAAHVSAASAKAAAAAATTASANLAAVAHGGPGTSVGGYAGGSSSGGTRADADLWSSWTPHLGLGGIPPMPASASALLSSEFAALSQIAAAAAALAHPSGAASLGGFACGSSAAGHPRRGHRGTASPAGGAGSGRRATGELLLLEAAFPAPPTGAAAPGLAAAAPQSATAAGASSPPPPPGLEARTGGRLPWGGSSAPSAPEPLAAWRSGSSDPGSGSIKDSQVKRGTPEGAELERWRDMPMKVPLPSEGGWSAGFGSSAFDGNSDRSGHDCGQDMLDPHADGETAVEPFADKTDAGCPVS
mmetsp:Transcript_20254/g.57916  ORF Transcript_20254/g.57916 Transcript_20254/m.57916 type:complete len:431 (+) Transcript_20254:100-1392(+)